MTLPGEISYILGYFPNIALELFRDNIGVIMTRIFLPGILAVATVFCGNRFGLERAIAAETVPRIAQQKPGNDSTDQTKADRLLQEAEDLYKKQTVESYQEAIRKLAEALKIYHNLGDQKHESYILLGIGNIYDRLGEKQQALTYYNQALPLRRAVGDRRGEANTLFNLAWLKHSQGNLQESLSSIEDAIKIVENLRTKVVSQDLRASYFATVQGYYEFYINLLMELHQQHPTQGYDVKAFETSDRSRARSLIELLTEARAKITTGVDPQLLAQEQDIKSRIDAFEKNSQKILNGNYTPEQKAKLQQQEINLSQQYNTIRDQIRISSPAYAHLKYPDPITLADVQQKILDDHTVLLQYSLGSDRSYLWLVTKTEISSYELPKKSDIEKVAQEFIDTLTAGTTRSFTKLVMKSSSDLSNVILKPVAEKLGNKRLLIIPDGGLQYTPFSALTIPDKPTIPLIADHEIVLSPSISTLTAIRQNTNQNIAPKQLVVFADPVFNIDDERFGKNVAIKPKNPGDRGLPIEAQQLERSAAAAGIKLNRLPYTRAEADKIITLVNENQRQELLDFNANYDAVNSSKLNQYKIIHFATHGFIDTEHPELSGVILSLVDKQGNYQNGYLRLNDIFNLSLNAKLVVLSACETGLGKEIKGEGLVGLTRGFMYAGTPRVLVSLWSINDESTSE